MKNNFCPWHIKIWFYRKILRDSLNTYSLLNIFFSSSVSLKQYFGQVEKAGILKRKEKWVLKRDQYAQTRGQK